MPKYILRTHPAYTLVVDEKSYRDGDPITLSEERAQSIAYGSKVHRFERVGTVPGEDTGDLVGSDRHRSGRHLRGESTPAPAGTDQDTTTSA